MSEILRTQVIRPTSRKATSTSYKIDTKAVGTVDSLRVEITHESRPGRWVFTFDGREINNRDSISFRVEEEGGKVNIRWSGKQPRNGTVKTVVAPATRPAKAAASKEVVKVVSKGRKTSFPPLIGEGCTVLVLGTMPGEKSLEQQQYYAHPRNRFWNVIEGIIGEPAPAACTERAAWLIKSKIALWDVAHQCEREGSLDSNIRDEEPNDLEALVKQYPSIRAIAFNGGKAEAMYNRFFKPFPAVTYHSLPSTSPANTVGTSYIEEQWSVLKQYVKGGLR